MNHRMPWGKHKGVLLSKVPGSYLFWVLEESDTSDAMLMALIRDELVRRLPSRPAVAVQSSLDKHRIIAWCRRAALVCHPDHGGSVEAMKLINELKSMCNGN